jgi:hypothetical protein
MRIYIIGDDGITLSREAPTVLNDGEIAVASNEQLHAAPLGAPRGRRYGPPVRRLCRQNIWATCKIRFV